MTTNVQVLLYTLVGQAEFVRRFRLDSQYMADRMSKIEQTGPRGRDIIQCMDAFRVNITGMDDDAAQLRLRVLRTHLMSIAEADRLYWSQKKHSREDASEYQRRQEKLNEIRLEMMTLTPGSVQ